MNLICLINAVPVQVMEGSFSLHQTVDLRSTLSFVVRDDTGMLTVQPGMPVELSDATDGLIFSGYVDQASSVHLTPNTTNLLSIRCAGPEYLADKAYARRDYTGRYAGDIAADLIQSFLAGEGVAADFAIRHDTSQGQFATGTLAGTVATSNGTLELAPAGTDLATELPGFGLPSGNVLKFVASAAQGFNNNFVYVKIWGGSQVVSSGDTLEYEVWISSSSPEIKCGVDLLFSDGSGFRDNDDGNTDYQNLSPHPGTDLSGLANDQWYYRKIGLSGTLIGKTIVAAMVSFEGNSQGTYTAYLRNVFYKNGATTLQTIYAGADQPQANVLISNNGYSDISLTVVTGYDKFGQMLQTVDLSPLGIVKSSAISWVTGSQTLVPPQLGGGGGGGGGSPGTGVIYGEDTFVRSDQIGWGTATDGQRWQHIAGSGTSFRVQGGYGIIGNTPATWDRFALGTNFNITDDMEIAVRVTPSAQSEGFGVFLRTNASGNQGYFVMYDGLRGSNRFVLYRVSGGTTSLTSAAFTISPGTAYWIKGKISGSSLQGKIWQDGTAEPVYSLLATDSAYSSGGIGIVGQAFNNLRFDHFLATNGAQNVEQQSEPESSTQPAQQAGSTQIGVASDAIATIQTSIDNGASWQFATNGQAIPRLMPGMRTAGLTLKILYTVQQGKAADTANYFVSVNINAQSAAASTKTDIVRQFITQADWNTGTVSNLIRPAGGGITLDGYTMNFDQAPISGVTVYGTNADGFIKVKQCVIRAARSNGVQYDGRLRIDGAGSRQNFIAECDVKVQNNAELGLVYRTTGWVDGNNTYAYCIVLQNGYVRFTKGGNGSPSYTSQTVPLSIADGSWHHLKIVVSGNSHSAYVDDALIFTWTDSTWSAAGQIGLRYYNATSTDPNYGFFDNFGVAASLSGSWTSPSISLAGAVSYGASQILWDESGIPNTTSVLIETSLDGGATWQAVSNGGAISGLEPGQSLVGVSLKVRATLTAQSASFQPLLKGLSVLVQGQYSASGSRVAPALQLSTVRGRAGFAQVSWNGLQPAGTSIAVDTSLDGSSWIQAGTGAQGAAPIAGITTQPDPVDDTFDVNSSAAYTSTFAGGGSAATWTWDTVNSRLVASGGNLALLPYNNVLNWTDGEVWCDLDQSEAGGLIWRYSDASNYYQLVIADDAALANPNTIKLYKRVAGTRSLLASAPTPPLARGTPHRIKVVQVGTQITVSLDGTVIMTQVDASLPGPGQVGLASDTGTVRFYQFRCQEYGQDVTALFAYSRVRLSSVDPRVTPQVTDLTLSVRSPALATGALIPQTNYSVLIGKKTTLAAAFDDLAKQSDMAWWLDANKRFFLRPKTALLAPWIVTSADVLNADIQIEQSNPLYRNVQWITGGIDTRTITEIFQGDGVATSWTVGYPVENLLAVELNGVAQSVGVKGVDSGKAFYWERGSNTITLDAGNIPPQVTQHITVTYLGQVTACVFMQDDTQITQMAAITGTDGVIEMVEDVSSDMPGKMIMLQLAASRLAQYAKLSKKLTATTLRSGLTPGMLLSVFLPEFGIQDEVFLLTDVDIAWKMVTDGTGAGGTTQQPFYHLSATSGPIVGDWARFLLNLVGKGEGKAA